MDGSIAVGDGRVFNESGQVYVMQEVLNIDQNVISTPAFRLNNFQVFLSPQLQPQKRTLSNAVQYTFKQALCCTVGSEAKVEYNVVITLPLSNSSDIDNLLSLHTSYESSYKNVLAVVDSFTGSVISVMSENLRGIEPGGKTDPVLINESAAALSPQPGESQSTIRKAADHLIVASIKFSNVLSTSAVSLAKYIDESAKKVETGQNQPIKVDPITKERLSTVKSYAEAFRSFSSKAVSMAIGAASVAGKSVSSKLNKEGDMFYVISKGIVAWNHLSEGVETSFKIVAQSASEASVLVIQKRYGDEASQLAKDLTDISKSCVLIYFDINGIGRKALLKGVAKSSFK